MNMYSTIGQNRASELRWH